MQHRTLAIILILLALTIVILAVLTPVLAYTPYGNHILTSSGLLPTPTPTPTRIRPTATPTPRPILTVRGPAPRIQASAAYLLDMDTGNVLDNFNGQLPLPMASTTKIMTALVAIQTADLDQPIAITQSDINHALLNDGSNAMLKPGETLSLKDLLYALLLPSGDDAAAAIARALGDGSIDNFVQRMNLFALRLRLFQTHYSNPDGLTLDTDGPHYTTAADLARLTSYALTIPLFAQIVKTPTYTIPATALHSHYTWTNTNKLLTTYPGMIGVKTGHTFAAGYCLVFAATHNGHHLLGVILNDLSEDQRNRDTATLLNWGFSLPLLPPSL